MIDYEYPQILLKVKMPGSPQTNYTGVIFTMEELYRHCDHDWEEWSEWKFVSATTENRWRGCRKCACHNIAARTNSPTNTAEPQNARLAPRE